MDWVSVKEKLPVIEKNSSIECLLYTKNRNVFNGWFDGSDGTFDIWADDAMLEDFKIDGDEITHWILLRDVKNPNQPERLSEKTKEIKNMEWISVKDRLPGIKQNKVLLYAKDHGYETAHFIAQSNGYFFCIGQDVKQTWEPEYWIPIPSLDAKV
jgi:hypothetical protein